MSKSKEAINFDRTALKSGIVHIGFGNFARTFIGEYANDLARLGETDWGYTAIAPTSRQKRELDKLAAQDYLYHLIKQNGEEMCSPVGALCKIHIAEKNSAPAIKTIAQDTTKIVTLTITRGGYCVDQDRKLGHTPEVLNDFRAIKEQNFNQIKTVPGLVTAGLFQRYKQNKKPFTVISCDNLPQNGQLTCGIITSFAAKISEDFLQYVVQQGRFPNSVVDRVTPHQNFVANELFLRQEYGVSYDTMPVLCEPYRKWVIEDSFVPGTKPPLDSIEDIAARVRFVKEISPYEDRKLRLLNGSHLAIGIVSKILQIDTVKAATEDKNVRNFWLTFLHQAASALRPMRVDQYIDDTIKRLENPQLTDNINRLLSSTVTKIGPRLLNSPAIQKNQPYHASAFAIAAWLRYLYARDESGNPFNLHAADLDQDKRFHMDNHDKLHQEIYKYLFPKQNSMTPDQTNHFTRIVVSCYREIEEKGLRKAIQRNFPIEPKRYAPGHKITKKQTTPPSSHL